MQHEQPDLLDLDTLQVIKRRKLLPWWIKAFIWIFLVFGAIIPIGIVFGLMGKPFQIALYSIETNHPFSSTGIALLFLFLLKTFVAYGLWTEKKWAIIAGIWDAVIGILICSFIMFIAPMLFAHMKFTVSFELLLLIPYYLYLIKIKPKWVS